ncbi:CRISPR-associated protein [Clostridium sp. DMHC 10]|uniref:CRISPR-associated endoribonuclease Cas6 n=1 Tax=Clostridium sp. DMHC 10 TaxID=747377 RepID=UPI00069FF478|nr:CRISPR-associated endoribonuclease Cas6 [Clostridium sp. DMHC 10]KOF58267.1 CRISPR-associated protein [Clostridium sp. DMHC 10]
MRLTINFEFNNPLRLPQQYNHIVQAVILNWLSDENYQKFIHDFGYKAGNRTYKLYTFSRLQGKFSIDRNEKTITYEDRVKLEVAAQDDKFLSYLANGIIMSDEVRLGNNIVHIKDIKCEKNILESGVRVYTKSPIVIYSTFENDDRKKTYYYSPYENEFTELVRKNLIKKYEAAFGKMPADDSFEIKALKNSKLKEKIIVYKSTIIKGWNGEFILTGSKELINIGYNSGFGSKNSQGFGCVEKCFEHNRY